MGRFTPARGLDETVASRFLAPAVDRLAEEVRDEGRRRAPDGKVWLTARDERVRDTHVRTDSQEVPANLRYALPSVTGVGVDLARVPRDPNLPIGNAINCRCDSVPLPGVIARALHKSPTVVAGTRVRAEVTCEYHRVVESEFPSDGDSGGRWLGGAVRDVASRSRSRSAAPGR